MEKKIKQEESFEKLSGPRCADWRSLLKRTHKKTQRHAKMELPCEREWWCPGYWSRRGRRWDTRMSTPRFSVQLAKTNETKSSPKSNSPFIFMSVSSWHSTVYFPLDYRLNTHPLTLYSSSSFVTFSRTRPDSWGHKCKWHRLHALQQSTAQ